MKRKVTTTVVEYYGRAPHSSDDGRSTLRRIVDALCSPPRHDFYPLEHKRHFYADGSVTRSIALANGMLYAGCCALGCPRRCVPIAAFRGIGEAATAFDCAMQAHDAAVAAYDLDVATAQRELLEQCRRDVCAECFRKQQDAAPAQG